MAVKKHKDQHCAIDKQGQTLGWMRSRRRNKKAAERFLKRYS